MLSRSVAPAPLATLTVLARLAAKLTQIVRGIVISFLARAQVIEEAVRKIIHGTYVAFTIPGGGPCDFHSSDLDIARLRRELFQSLPDRRDLVLR